MIYCPHCKKPMARDKGLCPHCGGTLTPSKVARGPDKPAPAAAKPADIGLEKTMMAAPAAIPAPDPAAAPRVQLKPNPFAEQPAQSHSPIFPQIQKLELKTSAKTIAKAPATTPAKSTDDSLELEPVSQISKVQPVPKGTGMPGLEVERSMIVMSGSMADPNSGFSGGGSSSGVSLDLDMDAIPKPAGPAQSIELDAPKKREPDDFKVREIAGFGIPAAGIVGTLKYWLKVRKRLDELAVEYDRAVEHCRAALDKKRESCAELGRQAGAIAFKDDSITSFIAKANAAQDEVLAEEQQTQSMASEHKAKIEPIDIKIKFVESEAAPFYEQEKQALEEHRKVVTARKRIEAKKSGAENEIKAIDEQIEKLQLGFSDLERPKEERDRLLKEIALIDRKRHPLLKQLEGFEKELSVLDEPLSKAEAKLREVRAKLAAKVEEIRGLTAEKNKLLREFNRQKDDAQKQLASEASKAEVAWASVGEKIAEKNIKEPKLEKLQSKALTSISNAEQAQGKVELISRARESYDKETVEKAKRTAMIMAAVGGALIILLLVLGKM